MAPTFTLINAVEDLYDARYGDGQHTIPAREIAELVPKVIKMLQEVAAKAAEAVALEHDDDCDPSYMAAEEASDTFWEALETVGIRLGEDDEPKPARAAVRIKPTT